MWIFGYGSLMWRVGFPYEERRPGYIRGYRRRFWQGSPDHRGSPEAPGRVVTLLPRSGERCWGMAYRIGSGAKDEVLAHLDVREQGGYERVTTAVLDDGDRHVADALVYIATADNPHYLGCAPLPEIADHVVRSRGPSGDNAEYVLELAAALRVVGATDGHVFRLVELVQARLERAARE